MGKHSPLHTMIDESIDFLKRMARDEPEASTAVSFSYGYPIMSQIYRGMDFEMPYPETWRFTEEKQGEWVDSVTFESPDSAFIYIQRFGPGIATDEILQNAIDGMKREYDEIEQEDLDFDLGGDESYGCDLTFYLLDLLVVSRLLALQIDRHAFLIQFQAEDRDFDRLRDVVHAMLAKALQSIDAELNVAALPR